MEKGCRQPHTENWALYILQFLMSEANELSLGFLRPWGTNLPAPIVGVLRVCCEDLMRALLTRKQSPVEMPALGPLVFRTRKFVIPPPFPLQVYRRLAYLLCQKPLCLSNHCVKISQNLLGEVISVNQIENITFWTHSTAEQYRIERGTQQYIVPPIWRVLWPHHGSKA